MKTKKFLFNWPSVLLGMMLCMVLVVFLGARQMGGSNAQTEVAQRKTVHREPQMGIAKNSVTLEDVMAKCELIDQRILILEGKIDNVHKRCNVISDMVERLSRKGK